MAATWTPFKLADGDTGYTSPNPSGNGYLYHGPDGKVYPTSGPGQQESPGVAPIGNTSQSQYAAAKTTNPVAAKATPAKATTAPANPYQPTYLGNPTQGVATTNTAASAGPAAQGTASGLSQNLMDSLGANATIADLQQSFVPQTNVANSNLAAQLAAAGISGGAGIDAGTQLASQLQAAQDPALAAALQNSQANQLNAGQYNASNQQQMALANQSALNNQSQYNAGLQQQSGLANQSAANQMTDTNLAALLSSQFQNANYANTAQTDYANQLMQAYYAQQQQFNQINNQGLSGQQNVTGSTQQGANNLSGQTAQNYGTSSGGGGYQSLAGAIGNIYGSGGQTQAATSDGNFNSGNNW